MAANLKWEQEHLLHEITPEERKAYRQEQGLPPEAPEPKLVLHPTEYARLVGEGEAREAARQIKSAWPVLAAFAIILFLKK